MTKPASTPIHMSPTPIMSSSQQPSTPLTPKAKSEIIIKKTGHPPNKDVRSLSRLDTACTLTPFFETNIGDTASQVATIAERCEEDILKIFMKKKSSKTSNSIGSGNVSGGASFKGSSMSLNFN